ncbi:hypothetical protein FQR65_LT03485 [Abscondita terminalis]|nr:hypothetical protein FQR65_LT03485 [Abscondita terminalis]
MAVTMTSIKFKVTPEEAQPISDPISCNTISTDFLSPHTGTQRNSLTSIGAVYKHFKDFYVTECSVRRRRPISLRIMPRLSLPGRSTSAPASVTEPDWSLTR